MKLSLGYYKNILRLSRSRCYHLKLSGICVRLYDSRRNCLSLGKYTFKQFNAAIPQWPIGFKGTLYKDRLLLRYRNIDILFLPTVWWPASERRLFHFQLSVSDGKTAQMNFEGGMRPNIVLHQLHYLKYRHRIRLRARIEDAVFFCFFNKTRCRSLRTAW